MGVDASRHSWDPKSTLPTPSPVRTGALGSGRKLPTPHPEPSIHAASWARSRPDRAPFTGAEEALSVVLCIGHPATCSGAEWGQEWAAAAAPAGGRSQLSRLPPAGWLAVLPGPVGGVLGAEALRVERTEAPPRPSPSASHSLPKGGATHLQQRLRTGHGVGGRRERERVSNGPPQPARFSVVLEQLLCPGQPRGGWLASEPRGPSRSQRLRPQKPLLASEEDAGSGPRPAPVS